PLGDGGDLGSELLALRRHFLQLRRIAGGEHHIGAGAGQHLRGERPEGPRRAGDDGGPPPDVEQGQRVLEEIGGHWSPRMALLAPPFHASGMVIAYEGGATRSTSPWRGEVGRPSSAWATGWG